MARRFVRVDLSSTARDFRPIAVEPGVPLLDTSNANARILFKWLGGLVAEPEWEAESVGFYVRDDHGGRLENVTCQPAGDIDLEGPLKDDFEALRQRIAKAKPETATERAVHDTLTQSFTRLVDDENRTDRDSHFFRYRDAGGRWRLVWCWGYQRVDQQPAESVICSDPDCGLLFVRRPGQSHKCPSCEATLAVNPVQRTSWKRAILVGLLLFLLGSAAVYWYLNRNRLVATPENWTGPTGSRVEFEVRTPGWFGFGSRDVSREALAVVSDPGVMHFDPLDCRGTAQSPGRTQVRFCLGDRSASATLTVRRAGSPKSIAIEPGGPIDRPIVPLEPLEPLDPPVEVVIQSDQGAAVRFPVGAEFDDFRVEARYPDGFTRIVTKRATLSTPEDAGDSPVAFSGGRIIGQRPGRTRVEANFNGIAAKNTLDIEVTADDDVDEILLTPSPAIILPGETIAMDAVGYRDGQSVGVITGLGGLTWKSDNDEVLGTSGPMITGRKLGTAAVTAQLGPVTSTPAPVSVVDAIADALVVDQDAIQMRVGESRQIGTDFRVLRGQTDLSRQAHVTSALPGVVEYVPDTHSLRGVSPGVSAVTFASGDKLATTTVEVLPVASLEGDVVIEPAAGTLAPGQALDLRVYLITPEGHRIDRTDSAALTTAAPGTVTIRGNKACAIGPGTAEVLAQLPEAETPGKTYLTVNDEEIAELVVEPARADMSVGDTTRLRILGRTSSGTRELFPQPALTIAVGGANPEAVKIVGSDGLDAVAPGSAEVAVTWADRLTRQVPVTVTDDPLTDLAIDPSDATVHPGQMLVYQVTGVRGGRRRVLTPADGVQLFVGEPGVAQVAEGTAVVGANPGRTTVIAQVGPAQAEATLNVVAGDGTRVVGSDDGHVFGPGYGYYGSGYDTIYGPGGRVVYGPDGTVITTPGYSDVHVPPAADAVDLRFIPDVLRMSTGSPAAPVQVVEVLADGSLGRNVTADPTLEFTAPPDVATVQQGVGGPVVRPVSPGQTRIAAKLGTLVTQTPLLVQVGDLATDAARLDVFPQVLDLWAGESGTFRSVTISPGAGQFPLDVDYRVTAPTGQGTARVEGDRTLCGLADGVTQVVVTTVDPSGAYDGVSTTATVRVGSADRLWIEPPAVSLQVGQSTPPFAVMAQGAEGPAHEVPAVLQSADPNVLAPDGWSLGVFVAQGLGATQVRASYRGREALAAVEVTGLRFLDVETTLDEGDKDFSVTAEVLAAASEGPLEYRIYTAGQPPTENWVPARPADDHRRVVLQSPRMPYGPREARYNLVIEARAADGSVQRYPFTFRLAPNIERTDVRSRDPKLRTP